MANSFLIKRKNFNEYEEDINKEKRDLDNKDIKSKIYEKNNILTKLDFNVELLNKHFVKCIENYLKSRYLLDISYSEKYISDIYKKELLKGINEDKKYLQNKDLNILIKSIDLISQNMESVNYVSDLLMNIKVKISYTKENIYTNCFTKIEEEFSQDIWFKNIDKGWFIQECKPKNIINCVEDSFY